MIKLSIIVPVYNVSQYLAKCLDSLLEQDISQDEYEIIVVNDGSTDNSGDIASRYAENYHNVVLINQDNKGLSGARNSGINVANGKYIQFVDSDDYLENNILKSLLNKMEKNDIDVLRFNYQNVNEENQVVQPYRTPKQFVDYSDNICDGITFMTERMGYACYVCQFIFNTELIKSQPLFYEGIYFEDVEWTPRILVEAKRVTSVDTVVYNYLVRQGSITKSVTDDKKKKLLDDKVFLIGVLKEQMKKQNDKRWYQGMIGNIVIGLCGDMANYFYDSRNEIINGLKKHNIFPIKSYRVSRRNKVKIIMINISISLYCFLLHKFSDE